MHITGCFESTGRTHLHAEFLLYLIVLIVAVTEGAKKCYSGQNTRFAEKQCSSGSMDMDYTCQKFTCNGGKSPFVLRTCALKQSGCLAGPRICQFSGGSVPFVHRDCDDFDFAILLADSSRADDYYQDGLDMDKTVAERCDKSAKLCRQYDGNGTCQYCLTDLCNATNITKIFTVVVNNTDRYSNNNAISSLVLHYRCFELFIVVLLSLPCMLIALL